MGHNLLEESAHNIHDLSESLGAMADIITTYAVSSSPLFQLVDQSSLIMWPLVTIPDFAHHARHVNEPKTSQVVWMSNIVSDRQRALWEKNGSVSSSIIRCLVDGDLRSCSRKETYCPVHQIFPSAPSNGTYEENKSPMNFDMYSDESLAPMYDAILMGGQQVAMSGIVDASIFRDYFTDRFRDDELLSIMARPVYRTLGDNETDIVAYVHSIVLWGKLFFKLLPEDAPGVFVVLVDTCGLDPGHTFLVSSDGYTNIGPGDRHDPKYEKYRLSGECDLGSSDGACTFCTHIYPASDHKTKRPLLYAGVIASTFAAVLMSFFLYDGFVKKRNRKIMIAATQTVALLSELFPRTIRDDLIRQHMDQDKVTTEARGMRMGLRRYLRSETDASSVGLTMDGGSDHTSGTYDVYRPMADLFPETTVLFADLAGFTAWSSGTFIGLKR